MVFIAYGAQKNADAKRELYLETDYTEATPQQLGQLRSDMQGDRMIVFLVILGYIPWALLLLAYIRAMRRAGRIA